MATKTTKTKTAAKSKAKTKATKTKAKPKAVAAKAKTRTKTAVAKPKAKAKTKTAPKKSAAAPKKPARKTVPSTEFKLFAPGASEVYLAGDFNNWSTTEYRARRFKDGSWKKMVKLKPGIYQYLYIVDGQWWTDPENPKRVKNPFGTENSVITI